ncbi:hypothetical protein K9N68_37155 (plasmid) [Kovacikia minuta CCNUW1]|uniref:hypothetical protein n=1 Tax=Kovacikia minuta TaxID=2931930 RepID=UPI001CCEBEFC|nr:hypothetical protein [Kovacikia minuta]UBF29841.1 hypothetical protein K9N68_37155 [Kovacikia minuta CCNUW1]
MSKDQLIDNHQKIYKLSTSKYPTLMALQEELNATLIDAARKLKPKGKLGMKKVYELLGEEAFEIAEPFKSRATEAMNSIEILIKSLQEENVLLAKNIPLESSGDEWVEYGSVSTDTYASQGFGAIKYALGAAQRMELKAKYNGLETRIDKIDRGRCKQYGVQYADFKVMIRGSETDVTVLKYKEGVSLKEKVRWMWKNGINPRVYYPFLPHGYEESNGISFL